MCRTLLFGVGLLSPPHRGVLQLFWGRAVGFGAGLTPQAQALSPRAVCTPNPKVTLNAPHPQHSHPPAPRPRSWSGGTASTVCPTQPPTHPPPALCTHPHRALHGQHGHALPAQPGAKHTNRSGPDPPFPCRTSPHCPLSSSSTRESPRASVVSNSSWVSAAREGQGRSRAAGGWKLGSKVCPCISLQDVLARAGGVSEGG